MASARFKYGDKVYAGPHAARVVSVKKDGNRYVYRVEFDSDRLIPREMEYEEFALSPRNSTEDRCPICYSKWTITKFNMITWKDCKTCGKTSEQIQKDIESKSRGNSWGEQKKELIDEIDKILNGSSLDDDDDDFGFFKP